VGQAVLTLAGLNVLLPAEAKVGRQVRAIAEDRMKVMRRMGTLALIQFQPRHAADQSDVNVMPDHGFGRCDGHHEMVDSLK